MFNILPFLLILLPLVVIIVIVVRKFPQLMLLDVDSLEEVKQDKKKDSFLKRRVARQSKDKKRKRETGRHALEEYFIKIQDQFREYVATVQRQVVKQKKQRSGKKLAQAPETVTEKDEKKITEILRDAQRAVEQHKLDLAETKYISAIRLDKKNKEAYKGLASVYVKQNQTQEALQTFSFLLHLNPKDESIHVQMAKIEEDLGNIENAITHYKKTLALDAEHAERYFVISQLLQKQEKIEEAIDYALQAVELEPENPRFLDNVLEFAILLNDKKLAGKIYRKIRSVNPENEKLPVWKEKIKEIPSKT